MKATVSSSITLPFCHEPVSLIESDTCSLLDSLARVFWDSCNVHPSSISSGFTGTWSCAMLLLRWREFELNFLHMQSKHQWSHLPIPPIQAKLSPICPKGNWLNKVDTIQINSWKSRGRVCLVLCLYWCEASEDWVLQASLFRYLDAVEGYIGLKWSQLQTSILLWKYSK